MFLFGSHVVKYLQNIYGYIQSGFEMSEQGYLLLQQNDFNSSLVGSFQDLRTANELFDVTLACEDETVEAHKVILSACSSFFRSVFRNSKDKLPFIYLKNVQHSDLVALLDYITYILGRLK